jgi:hypothetical protein
MKGLYVDQHFVSAAVGRQFQIWIFQQMITKCLKVRTLQDEKLKKIYKTLIFTIVFLRPSKSIFIV